jgi:hypothetical protein
VCPPPGSGKIVLAAAAGSFGAGGTHLAHVGRASSVPELNALAGVWEACILSYTYAVKGTR